MYGWYAWGNTIQGLNSTQHDVKMLVDTVGNWSKRWRKKTTVHKGGYNGQPGPGSDA